MIAWLQCTAGASGDMLLGALVEAGAPLGGIHAAVNALDVEPIEIATRRVTRQGVAATKVDVHAAQPGTRRTWPDVRALVEGAPLPDAVRARALDAFGRLAAAEAAVHGVRPEQVHFHEVGALDALADVVGACAALHELDVTEVVCSPVALGTGTTRSEHGQLPVPAPAVLELLRIAGAPVHTTNVPYELCTPTGAALLAATASGWGDMPTLRIRGSGAGAGSRDLGELPNALRLVLGERLGDHGERSSEQGGETPAAPGGGMVLLETNVDDLDPRLWPAVLDRTLAAGAADAWLTPILMKKGRPAHTLSVLTAAAEVDAVRRTIFRETSTLGIRERSLTRSTLERTTRAVSVHGTTIRVKLAYLEGVLVNAAPEYEDVAAAAATLGRPVRDVLAEASSAARATVP